MFDVTLLSGRRRATSAAIVVAAAVVAGCVPSGPTQPVPSTMTTSAPPAERATFLLTTGDRSSLLTRRADLPLVADADEASTLPTIDVDATATYQEFAGVGAALTDSSAWLISTRLGESARSALLNDLFGPQGARMSYVRVPLSASDFSLTDYTYDDVAEGTSDPTLSGFSIAHDEVAILPLLRRARTVNPQLSVMGSAWSAPGWMKTGAAPGRLGLVGGSLADRWVDTYAVYLRRVVEAYEAAGVPLAAITMQNEPGHVPPDYPGMWVSASNEARLAASVGVQLHDRDLATELIVHDHNWDTADRAASVLSDPGAATHADGVAFHCYGGNPTAQSTLRDRFPTKDIYFTECTGTFSSGNFASNLLWNADTLVIGAMRNWARTVLLWNLALDPSGGPRRGGCADCRGVVTIDGSGAVTRNEEYYALAHLGRAAMPGAVRVGSTAAAGGIKSVAFVNPDGTRGLVLTNGGTATTRVRVKDRGRVFVPELPGRSVATFTWRPAPTNPANHQGEAS